MNRTRLSFLAFAILAIIPLTARAEGFPPGFPGASLRHAEAGVIQSVRGNSFTLDGGRVVVMHEGTVVYPRGKRPAPGMPVAVRGDGDGSKRFNAAFVELKGSRAYVSTMARIKAKNATYQGGTGY